MFSSLVEGVFEFIDVLYKLDVMVGRIEFCLILVIYFRQQCGGINNTVLELGLSAASDILS